MKMLRTDLFLFMALAAALSCKKDAIDTYNGNDYIQFKKNYTDSSLFSFLALPNANEAVTPIAVELAGKPEKRERTYKVTVDKALSTATEAHFALPGSFTLKPNSIIDTFWITVKKSPDLLVKPVRLVLRIESTDDLKQGQVEYSVAILNISNVVAKPDWWNSTVENNFLGDYSDKKFKLFIEVTGVSDLDPANTNMVRNYTLMLKSYLLKEKDAGRTVYEDNGSEMTVALIGG